MPHIQFSHANGFPAKSYNYLFSLLNSQNINTIETMGHAGYTNKKDLTHLRDELIADIEKLQQPVIGIGHSSGSAATILAAGRRPDLFKHLILLDPIIFSSQKRLAIRMAKTLKLWDKFSPAEQTKRRRNDFSNYE